MKKFIRSYTDIRGLRKGTVYEVANFGNKILIPYYNKDEKPVPMTSVCFTRLTQDKFLVEVQPMRKEGTSEIWFVHRQEPDSIWSDWVSEKLSGIMCDDTLAHFTPVQL